MPGVHRLLNLRRHRSFRCDHTQCKIVLTDVDKGYTTNAITDSIGRYLFRNLAPSKYKIAAASAGFRPYEQTGISIQVNQNSSLDIELAIGQTGQTVEVVSTGTPLLATQDSVTGQNLDRTQINNLPLINRAVFDLAFLAPGVSQPAGSSFGPNNSPNNFISNGSRNAQADIIIDGVSTVNYEQNTGVQLALYVPSVEAIQEFKVQQSAFSAETGFSGGTVMNVVFRSGTNSIHGSGYYFGRNNALDANNFFNNEAGIPLSSNRRHQYGTTLGGSIKEEQDLLLRGLGRHPRVIRRDAPRGCTKRGDARGQLRRNLRVQRRHIRFGREVLE